MCGLSPSPSQGQARDFAPDNEGWNGLTGLMRMAEDRLEVVEAPTSLSLSRLLPSDALLIFSPRRRLPTAALTRFLRAGGRVALADDLGAGDSLLRAFRIDRRAPTPVEGRQLRSNTGWLVAAPRSRHPLADGVPALVTNYPSVVLREGLTPLFEIADDEALVLAGQVAAGHLVVVSDPSVLMNNMLAFEGNRRFARNLLDYLGRSAEPGRGRLFILSPDARVEGRFGTDERDPISDFGALLQQLAHAGAPPAALRVASLALVAVVALLAFGMLPHRSPYRPERMLGHPAPSVSGIDAQLAHYGRGKASLFEPLMRYKAELEAEVLARLGLAERARLVDVVSAMRQRGIPEAETEAARALLTTLDDLNHRQGYPKGPPHISPRRYRQLLRQGRNLLAAATLLDAGAPRDPPMTPQSALREAHKA